MVNLREIKFRFLAHGSKTIFLLIWLCLNIFLFAYDYYNYQTGTKYSYLRTTIKDGLPFARGSAACLNLNCALIVLCVCRTILGRLHGAEWCPRVVRRLINHNIALHKLCAWSIVFHTMIHTLAHIFNVEYAVSYFNNEMEVLGNYTPASYFKDSLRGLSDKDATQFKILFATVGGLTGLIMDLCLFLMVTSSIKIVRRSFFEVFWFTHHLFVVFFICLICHAAGQMIKSQSNLVCATVGNVEYCNYKCYEYFESLPDSIDTLCSNVTSDSFNGPGWTNWSKSYFWVGGPLLIYLVDRIMRWAQRFNPAIVIKAVEWPNDCLELRMKKKGWKQEAGQYVFIQCSAISLFEWHPFTLTSAPEEDFLSVRIRQAGDWTTALKKHIVAEMKKKDEENKNKPESERTEQFLDLKIAVDGPYGTPSDDMFKYERTVLIAAGVGCTPYASILKSVWYKIASGNHQFGVKKIYFYWLAPNPRVFGWLTSLFKDILKDLEALEMTELVTIRPFMTRPPDADMMNNIAMMADDEKDAITGIKGIKTQFGRPDWPKEFRQIAGDNSGHDIGVFFCGPAMLSEMLDKSCTKVNAEPNIIDSKTMFFYNKENF